MIANKSKNKLIVIEGIDGVGKTTIARKLSILLSAEYYKTPPEVFNKFVYLDNLQNKISIKDFVDKDAYILPQSRFLFYLFGLVKASQEIQKLLDQKSVICDRYISATLAYHWTLDPSLQNVNVEWLPIINPDLEFLLLIQNKEKYKQRLNNRQKDKTASILEDDVELLLEVQKNFKKLNLIEVITEDLSVTEVLNIIMTKIKE